MSDFSKITSITLYNEERVLTLVAGDTIVARYEVLDSVDAFDEGFTSHWYLKEFKAAEPKHEQLHKCIQCNEYDETAPYCEHLGGYAMYPRILKLCQGFNPKKEAEG